MNHLNEKQIRCIQLMCENNMEISSVAREIGVSRATIYNWLKDETFKAEIDKTEQDIKNKAMHIFVRRLPEAIDKLWQLTNEKNTEANRVKLKAVAEWLNRTLGKVGTSVVVEDKRENTGAFDIQAALERIAKEESEDD